MKRNRQNINKFNIILVAIFVVIIATVSLSAVLISNYREKQAFQEADGEIVVIFKDIMSEQGLTDFILQYHGEVTLVNHIGDYALLAVKESSYFNNLLHKFKKDILVLEVQANTSISTLGFSSDTYADAQWAIENPGRYIYLSQSGRLEKLSVPDIDMDVPEAWNLMNDSVEPKREVVVAVIDTGVDYTHPDLVDHMWVNEGEIPGDNIDNDDNGYIDDIYGWDFYNGDATVCHYTYSSKLNLNVASPEDNDDHGTHVAGVIGASMDNGIGVAGIASNVDVKIMALKINGGKDGSGKIASAVEAIKYATRMGADICNMSWGAPTYAASLKKVMQESDMLFVAAAGNTGEDNSGEPIYPASLELDNMISVTFINSFGKLTALSNYGRDSVDIAAPGSDIMSTIVGSYGTMSGSSMAAPQVSAIAALLYASSDHIFPANVKELIINNRKEMPELKEYMRYGGIPNAYRSLMAVNSLVRDYEAPIMSFDTIYKSSNMLIPVKIADNGLSNVRVVRWSLGEKSIEDFARGIKGTELENGQISVSKAGKYSFYASDYAGNEAVQIYEVLEDTKGPTLNTSYTVANNYKSRTVTVHYFDTQSGIKRLEYMDGKRKAEEFLPGDKGTVLEAEEGKVKFKVKKDGAYTVFGIDNRGNMSVKTIMIRTVKSEKLQLSQNERTMGVEDTYHLRAYITPSSSTDLITFTSSDESVASISSSGKITAKKKGNAVITVQTSSGLKSKCMLTVIQKSSG